MSIPTSDEGAPDENPPFDLYAKDKERFNYPYTMRRVVRATESQQDYRTLFLENEYLKCSVLPDLGGRIYTCIDKINGQPMFYANPSIKKALIGYRGVWATFGVEFNFPVSHNWVTLSPVDYSYGSKPDGSASIVVGNRDQVYGLEWRVELVLRPGSTVLEEKVTLSNPGELRHRFYWWNNAGVQVWDDSKIVYPTQYTASHGFTYVDTWPVNDKGRDLSIVGNHLDGPVSQFVHESREPFTGIYHPHTDAGVVHYAEFADLPAKKVFSFGADAKGLAWHKALSDNDSGYIEMQNGLFRNQETYGFLEPQQVIRFSEFWMPVRQIGGISRANLNGVVSMARKAGKNGKDTLTIALNANSRITDARIKVRKGDAIVLDEPVSLDPAKTWSHAFDVPSAGQAYTFTLENKDHQVLLAQTEGKYDWTPKDQVHAGAQPTYSPVKDAYLERGRDKELNGNLLDAWQIYTDGLAASPDNEDLLKAKGRLGVSLFRFEEASRLLKQAEDRNTSDGETRYYRGIAEAALGHRHDARIEFEAAFRDPSYRTSGGVLLAELLASDHGVPDALNILAGICPDPVGPSSVQRCVEDRVAFERASGHTDRARQLAKASLAQYPTSAILKNELSNLGSRMPDLDAHLSADPNRILDLVTQYNQLGLYADSLALLTRTYPDVPSLQSEPGELPPGKHPMLAYYRGFVREQLGQSGRKDWQEASRLPLRYVFPSKPASMTVLRAAIVANPSDASAHYLLGTLLFSKGMVDEALDEWRRTASIRPDTPTLDADMGRALLEIKNQPAEAAKAFEHGFKVDPANPALYVGMNTAMQALGKSGVERIAMFERFPAHADMPDDVARAYVKVLRENGQDDKANDLLKKHFLPAEEGAAPLQPQTGNH
ncbi:MAG: DUF5107 domain-containing protein [Dyella sp.]|nr:DUF5107 domain-containing protein [Dyella sp.]